MLAPRERRHEARPLLLGAEREQRQRRRARVHRDRHADARVGARELLEHEDVRQEVGAGAAVLLRARRRPSGRARRASRRRPAGSGARDPSPAACGSISCRAKSRVSPWISFCSGDELEVHARTIVGAGEPSSGSRSRARRGGGGLGSSDRGTRPASPAAVARAWSKALNANDNDAAADALRAQRPRRAARRRRPLKTHAHRGRVQRVAALRRPHHRRSRCTGTAPSRRSCSASGRSITATRPA